MAPRPSDEGVDADSEQLRSNSAQTPAKTRHHQGPEDEAPGTIKHNPAKCAKRPSPVQIRAAPPIQKYGDWVLDVLAYDSADDLVKALHNPVVRPAVEAEARLILRKAEGIRQRHVRDYQ